MFRVLAILIVLTQSACAWDSHAFWEARQKGEYGKAWVIFRTALAEGDESSFAFSPDQVATFFTAHRLSREYAGKVKAAPDEPGVEEINLVEAVPAIVEAAKTRRVVILNEEHGNSQSRCFAFQLASGLHEIGYRVIAAETFSRKISSEGPVKSSDGYYIADPFFGDFVRQAKSLGYTLIPYESQSSDEPGTPPSESINRREREQTNNLLERAIAVYPDEKLFIYVGYSHLSEQPEEIQNQPDGPLVSIRWMANRLAEKTGLDPLTIDQAVLTERGSSKQEHPAYGHLAETARSQKVLTNGQGGFEVLGTYRGQADIQVLHPRSEYSKGRPNWMRMDGYRQEVVIPKAWLAGTFPMVLEARGRGEPLTSVPYDRIVLSSPKDGTVLLLPLGNYEVRASYGDGSAKGFGEIEVRQVSTGALQAR